MKNITVMIGSFRQDSLNRATFNAYKILSESCFNLTEVNIVDLPLYNQDAEIEPEAVRIGSEQIKSSDGLIIFSPEYNYSIPGGLKNAIDWFSRNKGNPFNTKPCAIIGASPGQLGTARMQYHLRQVAVFLNMFMMNKPEIMINDAFNKFENGQLIDKRTEEVLLTHIEAFEKYIMDHG